MQKIQEWNPKFFTLSHIPDKYRFYVSKFIRRVLIARMAECPDLAGAYHNKLREAHETEDKLKNKNVLQGNREHLIRLLDEVETQLNESQYLAGEDFSMADVMLIPVLARLVLLDLKDEYINSRPNIAEYWVLVQQRPSYKKVIGRYFDGWRRYKTLVKTWCFVRIRSMLRRYWWNIYSSGLTEYLREKSDFYAVYEVVHLMGENKQFLFLVSSYFGGHQKRRKKRWEEPVGWRINFYLDYLVRKAIRDAFLSYGSC